MNPPSESTGFTPLVFRLNDSCKVTSKHNTDVTVGETMVKTMVKMDVSIGYGYHSIIKNPYTGHDNSLVVA
jgi:hypothetical protein